MTLCFAGISILQSVCSYLVMHEVLKSATGALNVEVARTSTLMKNCGKYGHRQCPSLRGILTTVTKGNMVTVVTLKW